MSSLRSLPRGVGTRSNGLVFCSLFTRLNKPNEGIVVVIGQRLHIADPMGAIAEPMRMEAVAIPAIA